MDGTGRSSKRRSSPGRGWDEELIERLPVGIYRTTPDGRIIGANAMLAWMLGFKKRRALSNINVKNLYIRESDRIRHIDRLSEKPFAYQEFELRRADGKRIWVRDYSRAVRGPDGRIRYFDGVLLDITELVTAERRLKVALRRLQASKEKLEELSTKDALTDLNNRRGFFTLGLQQMRIAKRMKKDNYLVFLDIDNLKEVNDRYGHAVGDLLLKGVADILRRTLRESDVIGRIGGDEFAVLAMRTKGPGERSLMARIEEEVRLFRVPRRRNLRLSVSMGQVRVDPQKYQQLDDFLAHADFLMYQQKRKKEREGTVP